MKKESGAAVVVGKIDRGINRAARWFSYIGGVAIILMALMMFVNIISAKVFRKSFNNVNELVDYLLIAVVFSCAADCQLNGGGLIQVDIFFRKFPYVMKKVVKGVGYVIGVAMYTFAGWRAFGLLSKHIKTGTLAASASTSFKIWPFTLFYIVGSFFLAFALLWSVFRMFFLPRPETELGPGDYDLEHMNVKGKLFADPAPDGEARKEEPK